MVATRVNTTSSFMKVNGSFTCGMREGQAQGTAILFTNYLDGVFNLKKIEERPDEGDDERCDDNEEEKVVVAESIVVESIDGLGRGGAGHADDPEDLGRQLRAGKGKSLNMDSDNGVASTCLYRGQRT
jgi:hypothetical protein